MPKDKTILFAHTHRNTCTHIKTYYKHRDRYTQTHAHTETHKVTCTQMYRQI